MAEIADAVSMTRQSIYVHFGSRGGLLIALVRRADERFQIWQSFARAMEVDDPRGRLDACLTAWLDFVPKIHPVATDLIRLRATDEDAHRAWADRMDDLHGFFKKLVRSLSDQGALSDNWSVARGADYLWTSCSVQTWDLLVSDRGWTAKYTNKVIRETIGETLLEKPAHRVRKV